MCDIVSSSKHINASEKGLDASKFWILWSDITEKHAVLLYGIKQGAVL